MKKSLDILAKMAMLYEGERGRRISPIIAMTAINETKRKMESLHESVILVQIYLKRKDKKDKTR